MMHILLKCAQMYLEASFKLKATEDRNIAEKTKGVSAQRSDVEEGWFFFSQTVLHSFFWVCLFILFYLTLSFPLARIVEWAPTNRLKLFELVRSVK